MFAALSAWRNVAWELTACACPIGSAGKAGVGEGTGTPLAGDTFGIVLGLRTGGFTTTHEAASSPSAVAIAFMAEDSGTAPSRSLVRLLRAGSGLPRRGDREPPAPGGALLLAVSLADSPALDERARDAKGEPGKEEKQAEAFHDARDGVGRAQHVQVIGPEDGRPVMLAADQRQVLERRVGDVRSE